MTFLSHKPQGPRGLGSLSCTYHCPNIFQMAGFFHCKGHTWRPVHFESLNLFTALLYLVSQIPTSLPAPHLSTHDAKFIVYTCPFDPFPGCADLTVGGMDTNFVSVSYSPSSPHPSTQPCSPQFPLTPIPSPSHELRDFSTLRLICRLPIP